MQQLLGLVLVAQHAHRRAHRDGHERHARLARRIADRVAVRAGRDADEQRAHALLEVLGDAVLERVRLLVHLVPGDAEDLHEEGLDQAVARDDAAGRLLAHRRERQALALVAHDEAVVDEAPHHLERRGLRDADRAGEVGLRRVDARLVHPEELLEVLLDRRREALHRGGV